MSSSKTAFSSPEYGKIRMDLYASIQNPYNAAKGMSRSQARRIVEKYGSIKHDIHAYDDEYLKHAVNKLTSPLRTMDYIKEYAKDAGIRTSDIFKDLGYDGIKNGVEWVAFDDIQVKSTDNIGLFSKENNDIYLELKDPDDIAYRSLEKANTKLEKNVAAYQSWRTSPSLQRILRRGSSRTSRQRACLSA